MRMNGRRRSSNVEDRRGQYSKQSFGSRRGTSALPMLIMKVLGSRTGRKFALPLVAIVGICYFVFPTLTQNMFSMLLGGSQPAMQSKSVDTTNSDQWQVFSEQVLASTEDIWSELFPKYMGENYRAPSLVTYTGGTNTDGCGFGKATFGPFYCPADEKVYIDLSFINQMKQMGAAGDFAYAYVVGHEVGHHVSKLTGMLSWSAQERASGDPKRANRAQVYVELQADCYAGVWAYHENKRFSSLEPGDIREAMQAAEAVGDDTLQRKATGKVVPDSFTHGTSQQRMRWFEKGFNTGDPTQCNTRTVAYSQL